MNLKLVLAISTILLTSTFGTHVSAAEKKSTREMNLLIQMGTIAEVIESEPESLGDVMAQLRRVQMDLEKCKAKAEKEWQQCWNLLEWGACKKTKGRIL